MRKFNGQWMRCRQICQRSISSATPNFLVDRSLWRASSRSKYASGGYPAADKEEWGQRRQRVAALFGSDARWHVASLSPAVPAITSHAPTFILPSPHLLQTSLSYQQHGRLLASTQARHRRCVSSCLAEVIKGASACGFRPSRSRTSCASPAQTLTACPLPQVMELAERPAFLSSSRACSFSCLI